MPVSPNVPDNLITLRHQLHRIAELSNEETKTAACIKDWLRAHTEARIFDLAGESFLALFESDRPGETVLLRSELDALPIVEINDFAYKSQTDGVSHKCGHDGHSTILCGVAQDITAHPLRRGQVMLLFQHAEETGDGARDVLREGLPEAPDMVFALHNIPGISAHKILCKTGSITPAVTSIIIRLSGKTSHAAEPEQGINPALAMAEIMQRAVALSHADESSDKFRLVTPIYMEMGEVAYGVSAGEGEIHLTLRAWTDSVLQVLCDDVVELVRDRSAAHGLRVDIDWTQSFSANENDEGAYGIVKRAATACGLNFFEKETPFKWGEDFGLFTQHYKGAMFGLGAGEETPALHNPDYDFPDEIIPTGVQMFTTVIDLVLGDRSGFK